MISTKEIIFNMNVDTITATLFVIAKSVIKNKGINSKNVHCYNCT